MLRITRLTDRSGRYYLADLASELDATATVDLGRRGLVGDTHGAVTGREGRPSAGSECGVGEWRGAVAAGLGLSGPVGADELGAVLSGSHPVTGRSLSRRPTLVHGFDLTFSAPKSVSVLFGMSDPQHAEEALAAHRVAVDSALAYLEARAVTVRRGSGDDRTVEPARGMVSAAFTHGVSRALDPHLHTHVVVANLTHGVDGRWTALDGRGLYAHGRAAGALYDAELRHLLSVRLDASWARRQSGTYELDAVAPVLIGALSRRRAEIQAYLYERAPVGAGAPGSSPRSRAVAWAATRDPKVAVRTPGSLRAHWRDLARDAGWSGSMTLQLARAHPRAGALDEHRFQASLEQARTGTVSRRDVVAAWARAVQPGASARAVAHCVDSLVPWGDGVGVAEASHPHRALLARPHQLRALGPRPTAPDALARWMDGAAAIERYRDRWLTTASREPLGVRGTPTELSAMPVRRLADHVVVTRELSEIRRQLDRDIARDVERAAFGIERSLGR